MTDILVQIAAQAMVGFLFLVLLAFTIAVGSSDGNFWRSRG